MAVVRVAVGLIGLGLLTGCASAHYLQVTSMDATGTFNRK